MPRVDAVAAAPEDAVAPRRRAQLLLGALLIQVRARLELVRRAEGERALREAEEAAAGSALDVELVLLPQLLEVCLAAVRLLKAALGGHLRGPGRGGGRAWRARSKVSGAEGAGWAHRLNNAVVEVAEPDDEVWGGRQSKGVKKRESSLRPPSPATSVAPTVIEDSKRPEL